MRSGLTANQRVFVFVGGMIGLAVMLWGAKGIFTLLPGPNPRLGA
jgi:hypothetical protein